MYPCYTALRTNFFDKTPQVAACDNAVYEEIIAIGCQLLCCFLLTSQ